MTEHGPPETRSDTQPHGLTCECGIAPVGNMVFQCRPIIDLCGSGCLRWHVVLCNLRRIMNERIIIDPKICHGKPVIRGTRVPVAIVVGSLAGGMSFEDVAREYDLSIDDIRAALKFASELIEEEQHHLLPT
jgi:uncharacterized protein (DUF433 family)